MKKLIQRGFAWGIDQVMRAYEPRIADRKRHLLGPLRGNVLEIGPGTGPNLKYFHPSVRWTGVESNPYMRGYLEREAQRVGLEVNLIDGSALEIPLPDQSVDAVVGTLVLCSVSDPLQTLREVFRVLKPDGRYYFIEHVAAAPGTRTAKVQDLIRPIWHCCADGCNVNRRTWETLRESPFECVKMECFELPFPIVSPHIMGVATR